MEYIEAQGIRISRRRRSLPARCMQPQPRRLLAPSRGSPRCTPRTWVRWTPGRPAASNPPTMTLCLSVSLSLCHFVTGRLFSLCCCSLLYARTSAARYAGFPLPILLTGCPCLAPSRNPPSIRHPPPSHLIPSEHCPALSVDCLFLREKVFDGVNRPGDLSTRALFYPPWRYSTMDSTTDTTVTGRGDACETLLVSLTWQNSTAGQVALVLPDSIFSAQQQLWPSATLLQGARRQTRHLSSFFIS
jgi:hypothetical protein